MPQNLESTAQAVQLATWLSRLELGHRKVRKVLESFGGDSLQRLGSDEEFEKVAERLCRVVGRTLYDILLEIWRPTVVEPEGQGPRYGFFFWPGYLRYATKRPGRLDVVRELGRTTLKSWDGESFVEWLEDGKSDGIGFLQGTEEREEIGFLPLSVWMHLLYGRRLGPIEVHGFTRWVVENGEVGVSEGKEGKTWSPLAALEFSWGGNGSSEIQDRVLKIPLDPGRTWEEMREILVRGINDGCFTMPRDEDRSLRLENIFPPCFLYDDEGWEAHSKLDPDDRKRICREVGQRALTVIFGTMFVNLSERLSCDEDCQARELWRYVRRFRSFADEVGLEELSESLALGMRAMKVLDGSRQERVFKYYYAIPMPRGLTIQGFHRIEADLGSINIYTDKQIPSSFLGLLQIWLQRVYEGLRLLEIASDAEQRGLRTAAGAFQHEVKHLANALGGRWIVPAESLFETIVRTDCQDEERSRVGRIEVDENYGWLADQMGVAPFRTVFEGMTDLLNMWTLSESVADLPFEMGAWLNFPAFADKCLITAQRALEPHGLASFSAETGETLRTFKSARDLIWKVFRYQRLLLEKDAKRLLIVRREAQKSVWLGRLTVAILKNAVQHGNPMEPIRLELRGGGGARYEMYVTNRCFNYTATLEALKGSGGVGLELEEAELVASAFNALHQGGGEFAAGGQGFTGVESVEVFRSGDIIEACLARLNGRIRERKKDCSKSGYFTLGVEFEWNTD